MVYLLINYLFLIRITTAVNNDMMPTHIIKVLPNSTMIPGSKHMGTVSINPLSHYLQAGSETLVRYIA